MELDNAELQFYRTETMTIVESKRKLLLLLLGSLAFVGVGTWMSQADFVGVIGRLKNAAGWFCAGFFGLAALVATAELVRTRTRSLVFSPDGFWDQRVSKRKVDWADIASVKEVSIFRNKALAITLRSDAAASLRKSGYRGAIGRLDRSFGFGHLSVSSIGLAASHGDIRRHFKNYITANHPATKLSF